MEESGKIMTFIPAIQPEQTGKKRVAAYCRVSTQAEEQNSSLIAQISYYRNLYSNSDKYELVDIYADRGISGTRTRNRTDFLRLIADCRAGKIDAVVCKSVSRFGRNTVDTLTFTRELKGLGIDVYFEKENLHTCSSEGELLLTLMAAVAESEAVSMSDNIKWGKRHRYKKGIVESLVLNTLLGFDQKDGEITVIEEEAETVRLIYDLFIAGHGYHYISEFLNAGGYPTKRPGAKWGNKTVSNILENEKYCGDCKFQKTYITDPVQHTKAMNRGELPQYLAEDVLPVIVPKEKWLATQELRKRCSKASKKRNEKYPFTNLLICPYCGRAYRNDTVASHNRIPVSYYRCKSIKSDKGVHIPGMIYTPPSRERISDPSPQMIAYRQKYNRPAPPRPMLCSDIRIPWERPKTAFVQAWNLIVGKKARYQAAMQRTAESDENPLTRYRAKEMIELLDTVGRITEFDYPLMLRTLDFIEVRAPDKLSFVFQCGIRITV